MKKVALFSNFYAANNSKDLLRVVEFLPVCCKLSNKLQQTSNTQLMTAQQCVLKIIITYLDKKESSKVFYPFNAVKRYLVK